MPPADEDQDEIDPDLPSLVTKTQNFFPSKRVTKWVRDAMKLKLESEQIKTIEKAYSHDPSLDDIFSPVKSIKAVCCC